MDIQFNNLRQEKDAIGVIFCDNKCRLIGYGKKLDQLSKKYISNIIKSDISFQERNSKNFDYSIIHQPANLKLSKLYVFKLKNFKDYQIRDFQVLGGHLNSLIKFYKETNVIVYPDGISSSKVGSLNAISEMILGMSLASYSFTKYFSKKDDKKNKNKTKKKKVKIYSSQHTRLVKNYESISAIHQGVTLTRNLVTEPPNVMTPPKIAEYAKSLGQYGVDVKVLGEKEMKKLGMGSLLGVGQGSIHESQLVIMKWNGARNKKKKPIAFIGKGVSFDTGGVSLKPSNGMEEMKYLSLIHI